jgi:hypothetical protein
MSLWTVLREAAHAHPQDEPHTIAARILDSLTRDDLIALLAQEIEGQQRTRVLNIERTEFTFAPTERPTVGHFTQNVDPLGRLRGERFALGNGNTVTWEHATIDQHQERISMLDRMREGIARTIDRHQTAVDMIRKAGVTCLADLDKPQPRVARRRGKAKTAAAQMAAGD